MANVNVDVLSNALAAAIQQAANHIVPTAVPICSSSTAMIVGNQPSLSAVTIAGTALTATQSAIPVAT